MRSPADMEVIQVEITNACLHSCSNCTRFCGHHERPFFMDWTTFQRAVDSLHGYDGIIGMMGGEPTLHPDFERMTTYLCQHHGMVGDLRAGRRPVKDFLTYTRAKHNANRVLNKCKGPGLWSSMPRQYYKHYELIQDSFVFQCLNDHYNPSFHQPLLIARKDLGIPDDKWETLRDACWIQNCWSASITPKGAFFCEVAAALDMLFDGPGGWPIVPGWWLRTPEDFIDQLHWCEMCGAPLSTKRRDANDHVDDVSPSLFECLQDVNSLKLKKGSIAIYQQDNSSGDEEWIGFSENQYIADFSGRMGTANLNLLPRAISGIFFLDSNKDESEFIEIIDNALQELDSVALLIDTASEVTQPFDNCNAKHHYRLSIFSHKHSGVGTLINTAMQAFPKKDWILLAPQGQVLPTGWRVRLKQTFINPGVFYSFKLQNEPHQNLQTTKGFKISSTVYLFNHRAFALRQAGYDGLVQCSDLAQFKNLWSRDKQISVTTLPELLPATDEQEWMHVVDRHFLEDKDFFRQFALVMSQGAPDQGHILITQSASYFLTRALTRLLIKLGYTVHLLTHERFAICFKDVLPSGYIITFNQCEMIKYDLLFELCRGIKASIPFSGAVVPYSSPRKTIEPEDGYQDIEKVAEYTAERIICRINLKRQFVAGLPDHRTVHDNRWGY